MSQQNKKFKKIIVITLISVAALLLVMYLLTLILPRIFAGLSGGDEEGTADFNFYVPDYTKNIYEDPEYMKLLENGIIQYDNSSNDIITVTDENKEQLGKAGRFMLDYIYSIIDGDHTKYNSFFSEEYIKAKGAKERFTMQKLYDVMLTYYSVETVSDRSGNYTKYMYKLSYRIMENNGTFRRDIGADAKTQYIVITDREGRLLIDAISTANYK